jgi:hypothetical protein
LVNQWTCYFSLKTLKSEASEAFCVQATTVILVKF